MTEQRWEQVKRLFQEALERPPEERDAFVEQACADDTTLRIELLSLLRSHDEAAGFLRDPPAELAARILEQERAGASLVGRRLGPYRLLQCIGRGGTGAVYLAVRDDDEFQKRVAVKVVRRGMATSELLQRFRSERQILASIEHPNIARLLDGGSTEEGLPYFVMEYIEGEPITRYCDVRRLGVEARLRLFRTVCAAVKVAHQNLVVHRDVKPGNILVTADGVPKLLDFGIAKLLNPELAREGHDPTLLELRVMTPEFASPEQIRGDTITTASDVYSLGVLLYELLTGHRPLRVAHLPMHEMENVICTEQPEPPSAVLSRQAEIREPDGSTREISPEAVAVARSSTPERLRRRLAGDLDNIVLKALRKEPPRRYASVEQLDEDIRRHLEGLPVTARPDTLLYRGGKFVQRHRLGVAVAATALLFAMALGATMAAQSRRLAAERDRAARAATKASVVSEFLQEVLASADPLEGVGRDVTVLQAIQTAVPRIAATFAAQPDVEAAVRHTIGRTLARLGRFDEAEAQIRRSLQLRRRLYGDRHAEIAESLNSLGEVRYDRGDLDGAERLYREAYTMRRELLGDNSAEVATSLDNLANVYHQRGQLEEAERMYREALSIRRRVLGPEHQDVASSLNNVAVVLHDQGRLDQAEELYRESLALARRVLGDEHPDVATGLNNLAALLDERGRPEEAEPLYREAIAMTRRLLGPRHPGVAVSLYNLGVLLEGRGEYAEAERLYQEGLDLVTEQLGPEHPDVPDFVAALAGLREADGRYRQAADLFGQALEGYRRTRPTDDPIIASTQVDYGRCLAQAGEAWRAEREMLAGWNALRALPDADLEMLASVAGDLAAFYRRAGRVEEAERFRLLAEQTEAGAASAPARGVHDSGEPQRAAPGAPGRSERAGATRDGER